VAAFGDPDLIGISEVELDKQSDELFMHVPIKFIPRKSDAVDQMVGRMIYDYNISIPVIWIKAKLYLVGVNRVSLEIRRNSLLARVGGGYEDLR
jgi:hypothetical protein